MKITDFNVAIVEHDSHLSKWVQEQRRLNVQEEYLSLFEQYIPKGGTVIDVGACIGDHTLTYANMVGPNGRVHAFEPNPEAFRCLEYNMRELPQVSCYPIALGSHSHYGELVSSATQPDNLGAVAVRYHEFGDIRIRPLDQRINYNERVDFIKIDAEGSEPDIIEGAIQTIKKHHPTMLIEVNRLALERRGRTALGLTQLLSRLGYTVTPSEPHHTMDMEQLDVLAVHGGL